MTHSNDLKIGQKYYLAGNFERSIKAFSEALEHGADPVLGYRGLGLSHLKHGDFDRAVDDFSYVLEFEGTADADAYFYRGVAHLNHDNFFEALADLTRAIALNPHKGAVFVARSLVFRALGKWKEAEADIKKAVQLGDVEVETFLQEYGISQNMYDRALSLFDVGREPWLKELVEKRGNQENLLH
jgi:tetratricopeptide (TPR) repeat protein